MAMKFSNKYEAKKKRIANLPKIQGEICMALLKKDADGLVKEFHNGIKNNTLDLEPLAPATIQYKTDNNLPRPEAPLYAHGDDEKDRSYVNMLQVKKLKNCYKVVPSKKKHHTSDLPLDVLLQIHEYGAIIKVTEKMRGYLHSIGIHLSPTKTTITIPPRPAFLNAYNRVVEKRMKDSRETSAEVQKAMAKLINDANDSYVRKLIKKYENANV